MTSLSNCGIRWQTTIGNSTASRKAVTVHELKDHLNVDFADDDVLIEGYLNAAAEYINRIAPGGIQLLPATIVLTMDSFPPGDDKIELPYPPLSSITSIAYYDADNGSQTMASTDYQSFTPDLAAGFLRPAIDAVWPATKGRDDAVTVTYIAGSTAPSDCIKSAIKLKAGQLYRNRDGSCEEDESFEMVIDNLVRMGARSHYG